MREWRKVERVNIPGVAYNGPAWVRTAEDFRGAYVGALTAVVPLDTEEGVYFSPYVQGTRTDGQNVMFRPNWNFGSLAAAKAWATMRLQRLSGDGPGAFAVLLANLDDFTHGYVTCALWNAEAHHEDHFPCSEEQSSEAGYDRYDARRAAANRKWLAKLGYRPQRGGVWSENDPYAVQRLAPEALLQAVRECRAFQEANADALAESRLDDSHAGHDFYLTRNRHGAGYWDNDNPDRLDCFRALTDASHAEGESELYLGDDRKWYWTRG